MEKLVIFDLDGTILHTIPDILDSINVMLNHFGHKEVTFNQVRSYVGHGAKDLVKKCVGFPISEEELLERLNYYNDVYDKSNSPKTCLFDGMDEVILTLKNRGYKLAILSNKPHESTLCVYERYLKKYNFDYVVGSSASVKCKPDKTAALSILEKLNVKKENAYFVGDGETDVLTFVNADIKGIACLWGYRDKDVLVEVGAKVFANSPKELLSLIQ